MRVTGKVVDDRRSGRKRVPPRRCRRCGSYMRGVVRKMYCGQSCQRMQAFYRKLWHVNNRYLDALR